MKSGTGDNMDRHIENTVTDAIAETQAYLEFLREKRATDKSAISYYQGILNSLRAVDTALHGDFEHLESFSVTLFRKSA